MHLAENINPGGNVAKGVRTNYQSPNGVVNPTNGMVHCKSEIDPSLPLLLPISPLQPYHNNGKFREILEDAIARNLSVIIVISDLPKKYTFIMEGEDESSSEKKAFALGPAWIKKNLTSTTNNDLFMKMNEQKKITVYCWQDLTSKYKEILKTIRSEIINKIYANEESNLFKAVKNAVDGYVTSFESRNLNNPLAKGKSELQILSTEHILEEVTMMFLWRLLDYKQMAYPNSQVQHKLNERLFNCIAAVVADIRYDKKLLAVFEHDCFKQEPLRLDNEMKLFDTKDLKPKGMIATTQSNGIANTSSDTKHLSPRRHSNSIRAGVNHTLFAANSSDMHSNGTAAQSAAPAVEPSTTPPDPLELLFKSVFTSPLTQSEKIAISVGVVNSIRNGHINVTNDAQNPAVEPSNRR